MRAPEISRMLLLSIIHARDCHIRQLLYEVSTDSKISNVADPLVARIKRRGNFSWLQKDANCVSKAFVIALTKALATGNPQRLIDWYARLTNGQIATC
jgi:hypothetical protein